MTVLALASTSLESTATSSMQWAALLGLPGVADDAELLGGVARPAEGERIAHHGQDPACVAWTRRADDCHGRRWALTNAGVVASTR